MQVIAGQETRRKVTVALPMVREDQRSPAASINAAVAEVRADCRCYIKRMADEVVFTAHWGAHSLECPLYRVSRDPVDNLHDVEFREKFEPLMDKYDAILNPE